MMKTEPENHLVFGLDIGTRNVVGIVGYRKSNEFIVVAHHSIEHETRAMLDGQIHDIARVAATITAVRQELEKQTGSELRDVCIAAAGRVLKTITTNVSYTYEEETMIRAEDIHTLELLGIEKAQSLLKEENDTAYKYYCVGYTAVRYFLNGESFKNLEGHKAHTISEEIIVTFLPEDVIDGLYAAVSMAGLEVANLTLEPIAAIDVAIPENFRLLNIAMVDVGAGTSDISITRDGSIIAYGMIPMAGDEMTELIVQKYLVDFQTAEKMKTDSMSQREVTYHDIMLLEHSVPANEIWELILPTVEEITTKIAEKIIELNGNVTVSATFVVGGGGKIHGFTELLAKKLNLIPQRVALRGEEVLGQVIFENKNVTKDPLLVTPIGICLNYYEQHNNFIIVHFNEERIKLYDNNKLTVVDAALQAGFPNDELFPKRGQEISYTVNGINRVARGEAGEAAVIMVNDRPASFHTPLKANCTIHMTPSTAGAPACVRIEDLSEFTKGKLTFIVNDKTIYCPTFVAVNGNLAAPDTMVSDGDRIESRNYYTVSEIASFMDVEVDDAIQILVNNRMAELGSKVYDNFTLDLEFKTSVQHALVQHTQEPRPFLPEQTDVLHTLPFQVNVNEEEILLKGKSQYVFVDIFDYIDFDLRASRGRAIITLINEEPAEYNQVLRQQDRIQVYWKEEGI
ncbi:MAG: cell division protein FtsA [Lachnospiraceae bacterium]